MNEVKKMSLSVMNSELSASEMEMIQAGSWQSNVACLGGAILYVAACSNPFSWAAATVVLGSGLVVVGSCW